MIRFVYVVLHFVQHSIRRLILELLCCCCTLNILALTLLLTPALPLLDTRYALDYDSVFVNGS